jgi:hypothetical protein
MAYQQHLLEFLRTYLVVCEQVVSGGHNRLHIVLEVWP